MRANFYDVFGGRSKERKELPKEVIDAFNRELPHNLAYIEDENGRHKVSIRQGCDTIKVVGEFDDMPLEDKELLKKIGKLPYGCKEEYLYRLQKSFPLREVRVGDEEKMIPIEIAMGELEDDSHKIVKEFRIFPEAFPEPKDIVFETKDGEKVSIKFQQVAYDSLVEVKFSNVDFPALKMDIYVYSPIASEAEEGSRTDSKHPICTSLAVTPVRASSTGDAIMALNILKGFYESSLKINEIRMNSIIMDADIDPEKIDKGIHFWTTAAELEKKLEVSFDPSADFPMEQVKLFDDLVTCLINNRTVSWEHPCNEVYISELNYSKEEQELKDKKRQPRHLNCIEGPIQCNLLGAKFDIYSESQMRDFVITNIRWDPDKSGGRVFLSDAPGKKWVLERLYKAKNDFLQKGLCNSCSENV